MSPHETDCNRLIKEAAAFLQTWRAHPEADPPSEEACELRLQEIAKEVQATGLYTHSARELEFGARLAWKHSNRCIGRHLWRSLEVRDCRTLHNAPDREERTMEALTGHLKDAYRNGKIKSIISIFAPRTPGQPDPVRMANHQLIRYAGFAAAGDPDSRTITSHFLQVGWKPAKQDDFTLLPWQFYWDEWPGYTQDVLAEQPELAKEGIYSLRIEVNSASASNAWYAFKSCANSGVQTALSFLVLATIADDFI